MHLVRVITTVTFIEVMNSVQYLHIIGTDDIHCIYQVLCLDLMTMNETYGLKPKIENLGEGHDRHLNRESR